MSRHRFKCGDKKNGKINLEKNVFFGSFLLEFEQKKLGISGKH